MSADGTTYQYETTKTAIIGGGANQTASWGPANANVFLKFSLILRSGESVTITGAKYEVKNSALT